MSVHKAVRIVSVHSLALSSYKRPVVEQLWPSWSAEVWLVWAGLCLDGCLGGGPVWRTGHSNEWTPVFAGRPQHCSTGFKMGSAVAAHIYFFSIFGETMEILFVLCFKTVFWCFLVQLGRVC